MKKTTSYFLLLFLIGYCFSSAFSQNPPTLGYVIEVKLVDGGSYSNFYPTLQEARKDPVLAHFGVLYDPEYNSLKLHGDGLLNINGAGATFYNVQYEDWKPRSGSELELREDHPDTLTVAIVFWKLGGRHVVKEYKTYRKITDDMRPGTSRPQMPPKSPQEQTIRLNKALTWKSHPPLTRKSGT